MTVGSLFAGVGGFDRAFENAGFETRWAVEIDDKARSVFARHFPDAKLFTDVRNVGAHNLEPVDVIVGGFPCQDLSVAGKREGLDGARSGLFYELCRIVAELSPEWLCLENVPGLLSSNGGRDMGAVVGTLVELGYGLCWRVLDAKYFGVPQRRRRVFIVGRSGGRCPVEVLFEPESVCGHPAPGPEAGQSVAGTLGGGPGERCDVTLTSRTGTPDRGDTGANTHLIPGPYWDGGDLSDTLDASVLAKGQTMPEKRRRAAVIESATAFAQNQRGELRESPIAPQLTCGGGKPGEGYSAVAYGMATSVTPKYAEDIEPAMAFRTNQTSAQGPIHSVEQTDTLAQDHAPAVQTGMTVRRLTPVECERLQGFPDGWTEGQADSARYKQMGNAVAVPCVEWIARRLWKEAHR